MSQIAHNIFHNIRNKKLCRCRGATRRATNTKNRTWKALQ